MAAEIKILEFMGTCSSQEIGDLAELKGKKCSYKRAKKAVLEFDPEIYYDVLLMDYWNPYDHYTNIKEVEGKGTILHIVNSAIDYLFKIEKS